MIITIQQDQQLSEQTLQRIKHHLEHGGLLFYPTETTYGLGCDAFNVEAIKEIILRKKRPADRPMSVIVPSLEVARTIALVNPKVEKLSAKYHPGPLVIALPKRKSIPDILNKKGIAFRISSNRIVQQITRAFQRPLVSTSANLSCFPSPYSVEEIHSQLLLKDEDIILDAGILPKRKPSTLIDFQLQPSPQIIREGEIPADAILETLEIPTEKWPEHKRLL